MTGDEFLDWVDKQCMLYPWQRQVLLRLLEYDEEHPLVMLVPPREMPHWEDIVPNERFL